MREGEAKRCEKKMISFPTGFMESEAVVAGKKNKNKKKKI